MRAPLLRVKIAVQFMPPCRPALSIWFMDTYLFNCTTNIGGGTTQNAANFVALALKDPSVRWHFALSPHVHKDLLAMGVQLARYEVFETPSQSPAMRKAVLAYERSIKPGLTYTMAGPAFIKFDSLHVLGCSNPYVSNLDRMALMCGRNYAQAAVMYLRSRYQLHQFKAAQFWIFQTESSRQGFCQATDLSVNKTAVVPNSVGLAFAQAAPAKTLQELPKQGDLRIFVPSLEYPHKALHIIPDVAYHLKNKFPNLNPIFTLTVSHNSEVLKAIKDRSLQLGVQNNVLNHGHFPYAEAPALYTACDLVFLPSILEVFSTSYLEAMATGKPLVVADRAFSREICEQAALFANPLDAEHSAAQIAELLNNPSVLVDLAKHVPHVLAKYKTYETRYANIMKALRYAEGFR
jgi:glycosyltransferase involved in cell wall biosynthesis